MGLQGVLADKSLVAVERSCWFNEVGLKRNGNNVYTVLPTRAAVEDCHQRQLRQVELDTARWKAQQARTSGAVSFKDAVELLAQARLRHPGPPKRHRRQDRLHHAGLLRRRLHPAHLHPRHPPIPRRRRKDECFHGTGDACVCFCLLQKTHPTNCLRQSVRCASSDASILKSDNSLCHIRGVFATSR